MLQGTLESDNSGGIPEATENAVRTPLIWTSGTSGHSQQAQPVSITLKPGSKPVKQKQYPLKLVARRGIKTLIENFREFGLLI